MKTTRKMAAFLSVILLAAGCTSSTKPADVVAPQPRQSTKPTVAQPVPQSPQRPTDQSKAQPPLTSPTQPEPDRRSKAQQERKPDLRDSRFLSEVTEFRIDIPPKSEVPQDEPLVSAQVAGSRTEFRMTGSIMQNDVEPEGLDALRRGTEAAVVERGYAVTPAPNAAVLRIAFLYPLPVSTPLRVAPDGTVIHSLSYNLKVSILRPDGAIAAIHTYLGFIPVDYESEPWSPGQPSRMRVKPQWSELEPMVKAHLSDFLAYVRSIKTG